MINQSKKKALDAIKRKWNKFKTKRAEGRFEYATNSDYLTMIQREKMIEDLLLLSQ